jgi:hypothetical protein
MALSLTSGMCSTDPSRVPAIPPPLGGGCIERRTLPRVAHRPPCGRCSTRGYSPPPRWGGPATSRLFPRVALRPPCGGLRFTRGYSPPPRWGGPVNSRLFPRVALRPPCGGLRFTRGYIPRPRWGRRVRHGNNAAFWRTKRESNLKRDRKNVNALRRAGWRVVVRKSSF